MNEFARLISASSKADLRPACAAEKSAACCSSMALYDPSVFAISAAASVAGFMSPATCSSVKSP